MLKRKTVSRLKSKNQNQRKESSKTDVLNSEVFSQVRNSVSPLSLYYFTHLVPSITIFTLELLAASFHQISSTNQSHRQQPPHQPQPHSFCPCLLILSGLTQPMLLMSHHQHSSLHLLTLLLLVLLDPIKFIRSFRSISHTRL